jgi:hypothetical protein
MITNRTSSYMNSCAPVCLYLESIENFNMDKPYPLRTPMIVHVLEKDTYPFRPRQKGEEVLGAEYPYLSVIVALMYLANNTRSVIAFAVNHLIRHSATPTMHHWNDIKNILRYLNDTIDLGLFFRRNQDSCLIGMQMLAIYPIHNMSYHKQDSCFYTEGLLSHGSMQNIL